jgi:hypothetical protein
VWECKKCCEPIEDSFDACWRCGTSSDGVEDASFQSEAQSNTDARPRERQTLSTCAKCGARGATGNPRARYRPRRGHRQKRPSGLGRSRSRCVGFEKVGGGRTKSLCLWELRLHGIIRHQPQRPMVRIRGTGWGITRSGPDGSRRGAGASAIRASLTINSKLPGFVDP